MSAPNRSCSNHLRSPDRMRKNVPVHTEVFQGVFLKLDVKTAHCEATVLREPELQMWADPNARSCFQMFPHTWVQFNPFITSRHQKASAWEGGGRSFLSAALYISVPADRDNPRSASKGCKRAACHPLVGHTSSAGAHLAACTEGFSVLYQNMLK